jgi:diaminopropionate ammonia-lyase
LPTEADAAGWFASPGARSWTCGVTERVRAGEVRAFHAGLPGYAPTPLTGVPALAAELGAGQVFVKDESARLGLPAFKVLGASWAVQKLLTDEPGGTGPNGTGPNGTSTGGTSTGGTSSAADPGSGAAAGTLEHLRTLAARRGGLVLVTATDGNHGRAVARMARLVGAPAHVFVPAVTRPPVIAAIAGEGAQVTRFAGDYDETVAAAARWAAERPGAELVQDTAWPGYERVPGWIAEGYSTLFAEIDAQLAAAGAAPPALVVVPVGVGSLAQAAVAHYRAAPGPAAPPRPAPPGPAPRRPALLAVEPDTAACLLASLRAGTPVPVPTAGTIMAGLNCGTISTIAWPYLSAGLDAAVAVSDAAARRAVADLARAGISAGPSGAASLAGARAALTGPGSESRRAGLAVGPASVIVLLSTEAGASPE